MRSLKVLYAIILTRLPSDPQGICCTIQWACDEHVITQRERDALMTNWLQWRACMPKAYRGPSWTPPNRAFWWNLDEEGIEARKCFLTYLIENDGEKKKPWWQFWKK